MTGRQQATEPVEMAAALDLMLTDAALGTTRRFLPAVSGVEVPRRAGPPAATGGRPGRRAAGRAGPDRGRLVDASPRRARDRRFTDPAWTQNPVLRRIVQAYLATGTHRRGAGRRTCRSAGGTPSGSSSWSSNLVEAAAPSQQSRC